MTDKQKLEIYDSLRQMHNILKAVSVKHHKALEDGEWEMNAIDAVGSVLYLAEGVFSKMSD